MMRESSTFPPSRYRPMRVSSRPSGAASLRRATRNGSLPAKSRSKLPTSTAAASGGTAAW